MIEDPTSQTSKELTSCAQEVWSTVSGHVSKPHGNDSSCDGHEGVGTSVRFYFVATNENGARKNNIAVIAVRNVGAGEYGREFEDSNWRVTESGSVAREGLLFRPGLARQDRYTDGDDQTQGVFNHPPLIAKLSDMKILLELVKHPDANLHLIGKLSKLPREKPKKGSRGDSPRRAGRSRL